MIVRRILIYLVFLWIHKGSTGELRYKSVLLICLAPRCTATSETIWQRDLVNSSASAIKFKGIEDDTEVLLSTPIYTMTHFGRSCGAIPHQECPARFVYGSRLLEEVIQRATLMELSLKTSGLHVIT